MLQPDEASVICKSDSIELNLDYRRYYMKIRNKIILSSVSILFLSIFIISIINILNVRTIIQNNIDDYSTETLEQKKTMLKNNVLIAYQAMKDFYDRTIDLERLKEVTGKKIKPYTDLAYSEIELYYQMYRNGELTEREAQRAAIRAIEVMRFGEDGYFWIQNYEPRMIMHPVVTPQVNPDWYKPYGVQDLADPTLIRITEKWKDQEALTAHFNAPHMAEFMGAMASAKIVSMDTKLYDASGERPVRG